MTERFYKRDNHPFTLLRSPNSPAWRAPQIAALGAAVARWSLKDQLPPLVSIPTGTGKTAIALAAPYLVGAERVLVVVPTQELRRQISAAFKDQRILRAIGALPPDGENPRVLERTSRSVGWDELMEADVVVSTPASISPGYFEDSPAPRSLFDLVIVDEAHHAPAETWQAILEYFEGKSLLLTATPVRRDGRRLPADLVYYFPIRQAIAEGIYQPVEPLMIDTDDGATQSENDLLIATRAKEILAREEYAASTFVVRARTIARAKLLAELYADAGQPIPVLHSRMSTQEQKDVVDGLRSGAHRGVSVVGMLVEGFDLPSLRVVAYHDKHKSIAATAQLIGRLARVHPSHPESSVLVTVRDADVYPHLVGVVRQLYDEDADWQRVIPGLIDEQVEATLEDAKYAHSFAPSAAKVDLSQLAPLRRACIFEAVNEWVPDFTKTGRVPESLEVGGSFLGGRVVYSGVDGDKTTLLVVTSSPQRPRWSSGPHLDSECYSLFIASFRASAVVSKSDLLLLNVETVGAQNAMLDVLGARGSVRIADPKSLQEAFDSLPRVSVSSLGVRSPHGATRGRPSYRMFAGKSIEEGMRDAEVSLGAMGHAMAQVGEPSKQTFSAGFSSAKGKFWESRYTPLRGYEQFVTELAQRYWFPTPSPSGPLFPRVRRSEALVTWPEAEPICALIDSGLIGQGWRLFGRDLDMAEVWVGSDAVLRGAVDDGSGCVPLAVGFEETSGSRFWFGRIDKTGRVYSDDDVKATRGYSATSSLAELLSERPPTIFFADGSTVRGIELFAAPVYPDTVPRDLLVELDWNGVDIQAETRAGAQSRGSSASVHERVEDYLIQRAKRGRRRWVLLNDGTGEIADHVVIELVGPVCHVELWHSKYAGGGSPATRVTDLEVVCAQAIKSRRWPTDRKFWDVLGRRFSGQENPRLVLVDGDEFTLRVLLGLEERWARFSLAQRRRSVEALVGIVQPGLSISCLRDRLPDPGADGNSARQIVQLLNSVRDAVSAVGGLVVLASK